MKRHLARLVGLAVLVGLAAGPMGCEPADESGPREDCYHVYPGTSIQDVLERAAADSVFKTVRVHAGTYRPQTAGQALVWFNARHDGITLEAVGEVILTAANPEIAARSADSYPALVNHVVYFGDGIGRETTLRGFRITGANGFVTREDTPGPIEPSTRYEKIPFFYSDGGAIKIFGESYPTLDRLEIYDNYADPCAGGISVHHPLTVEDPRGEPFDEQRAVLITNSIFRGNRARTTGSALDLLWGSSAIVENCLFVGNVSNTGIDTPPPGRQTQYDSLHGCGALTVFRGSRIRVDRSTFTGNFNGVDDMSFGNAYTRTIFWRNDATGGVSPGPRYEVAMHDGNSLDGCFLGGELMDLRGNVPRGNNTFDAADPDFDTDYRPRSAAYRDVGYRPVVP